MGEWKSKRTHIMKREGVGNAFCVIYCFGQIVSLKYNQSQHLQTYEIFKRWSRTQVVTSQYKSIYQNQDYEAFAHPKQPIFR